MNHQQPFIVFSVYNKNESNRTNVERHVIVSEFLDAESIKYLDCVGVYDGCEERSFLVPNTDRARAIAENAAASYGQESILLVDSAKNAELVYRDGTRERIGTWRKCKRNEEPKAYTEYDGKKYTCS